MPSRMPYPTAAAFQPETLSMRALRDAVQQCMGCPLYANATQAVFGDGKLTSEVMLVGEQPGDQEDRAGAPFVGPAGKLLDRALDEAGIDRRTTYVTNAVKHFKWKARGPRRIHQKPAWSEQMGCRPWREEGEVLLEPGWTGHLLAPGRLLVDPAGPARLPLEVLDGVRDVGRAPVDARCVERPVE